MKTVLVVDQEGTARKLLAGRLEIMEFEVLEAGTVQEVKTILETRTLDLVISDTQLPECDASCLAQKFKTLKCPLLIFTAKTLVELGADWKLGQVKGNFHKSQRADLLKKVLELVGWSAGQELRERNDQKHILLIEDSPTIRNMIRKILQKSFPDSIIREASDGREALSEMSNKKVDFIITDLQMPGMDGHAFLKILHSNPLLKNKPVIVLSSSISSQLREDLRGYESVRLLAKPSSPEEISETVTALMKTKATA